MKPFSTFRQSECSVRAFCAEEDGAVTVDWVVLTAAVVGLGIAVLASVTNGSLALGGKISDTMGTFELGGDASGGDGGDGGGGDAGTSSMTFGAYLEAHSGNLHAAAQAVYEAAPDGFSYTGQVDLHTGQPIYENGSGQFNIGGQTMDEGEYLSTGGARVSEHEASYLYDSGYYNS